LPRRVLQRAQSRAAREREREAVRARECEREAAARRRQAAS